MNDFVYVISIFSEGESDTILGYVPDLESATKIATCKIREMVKESVLNSNRLEKFPKYEDVVEEVYMETKGNIYYFFGDKGCSITKTSLL